MARPRRTASRTGLASPPGTRTTHRPPRSGAVLLRARYLARALPSRLTSRLGVDAILGPGPDGPPRRHNLSGSDGRRRARGCRRRQPQPGRAGPRTGDRRTRARAPRPIASDPTKAGPAATTNACGSRGRTSPRLRPSCSTIRLCASVRSGRCACFNQGEAATAAFVSEVVAISCRVTAGRRSGNRAASDGALSDAVRAIAVASAATGRSASTSSTSTGRT